MNELEASILRELRMIRIEQKRQAKLIAPFVTRRLTRTEKAKLQGVSKTTSWRLEKKQKLHEALSRD